MNLKDERALLTRAQQGAAGFGELFDAYYDRIYTYAYRRVGTPAVAEDIAATVFEDALHDIKRVRWQDKPLIAWLYRIAARRVVDHYRRNQRAVELAVEQLGAASEDLGQIEIEEDYAAVRCALSKLSEAEREIILLAYFDDLSGDEIAATLHCTPNNAYVRLHRALKKLKSVMQVQG